MGATGRNIVKFIAGSAIGAGIGALITRAAESNATQGPTDVMGVASTPADSRSLQEKVVAKVTETRESLRQRWEEAKAAGEAAEAEREAELRAYFREKVNDPTAFPPGAPTRTDG